MSLFQIVLWWRRSEDLWDFTHISFQITHVYFLNVNNFNKIKLVRLISKQKWNVFVAAGFGSKPVEVDLSQWYSWSTTVQFNLWNHLNSNNSEIESEVCRGAWISDEIPDRVCPNGILITDGKIDHFQLDRKTFSFNLFVIIANIIVNCTDNCE